MAYASYFSTKFRYDVEENEWVQVEFTSRISAKALYSRIFDKGLAASGI